MMQDKTSVTTHILCSCNMDAHVYKNSHWLHHFCWRYSHIIVLTKSAKFYAKMSLNYFDMHMEHILPLASQDL